jgi:hypothetical protein
MSNNGLANVSAGLRLTRMETRMNLTRRAGFRQDDIGKEPNETTCDGGYTSASAIPTAHSANA